MRQIKGQITGEIEEHIGHLPIDKADAFPITTYRRLVEQVAKLAYLNKDHLLFFRGQGRDYRNKGGASTFYPTIYRGEYVQHTELVHRFNILEEGARRIRKIFEEENIQGLSDLAWKKYVQWSILQHYEVCDTPLFDLTHSLRVACSFAQEESSEGYGYVYVFALPYVMNRISHNSEHDIVNIRLLSICPPEALRPYFQEGYLAGTEDITVEYNSKESLDFRNRLIAKFRIPSQAKFWGDGFTRIPNVVLYPNNDRINKICRVLKDELKTQLFSGQVGDFIGDWTELEEHLLKAARDREDRVVSINNALKILASTGNYSEDTIASLQELSNFRNSIVQNPEEVSQVVLEYHLEQLKNIEKQIITKK